MLMFQIKLVVFVFFFHRGAMSKRKREDEVHDNNNNNNNKLRWFWKVQTWQAVEQHVTKSIPGWSFPEDISHLIFDFTRHSRDELQLAILDQLQYIKTRCSLDRCPIELMIRQSWWNRLTDDHLLIVSGVRRMLDQLATDRLIEFRSLISQFEQIRIVSRNADQTRWVVWHYYDSNFDEDDFCDTDDHSDLLSSQLRICLLSPKDASASLDELILHNADKDVQRSNWFKHQRVLQHKVDKVCTTLNLDHVDARRGYNSKPCENDLRDIICESSEPLLDQILALSDKCRLELKSRLPPDSPRFSFGLWLRDGTIQEYPLQACPEKGVVQVGRDCSAVDLLAFLVQHAQEMNKKTVYYGQMYEKLIHICKQAKGWSPDPKQFKWYYRTQQIAPILEAAQRLQDHPPSDVDLNQLVIYFGHKSGLYRILHGDELILPPDWTPQRLVSTVQTWLPHRCRPHRAQSIVTD